MYFYITINIEQIATELIYERLDKSKDNMGLASFKGAVVRKGNISISKSYLYEEEIRDLNCIITMFLDHAEDMARDRTPMTMNDWDNSPKKLEYKIRVW